MDRYTVIYVDGDANAIMDRNTGHRFYFHDLEHLSDKLNDYEFNEAELKSAWSREQTIAADDIERLEAEINQLIDRYEAKIADLEYQLELQPQSTSA